MAARNGVPVAPALSVRSRVWWCAWQTENRDWGYRRILGALSNLGYTIGRGIVANILKQQGIEPAPERSRKTTWKEFLRRHCDVLVAADFFTVEVWTRSGLTRFLVLF